MEKPQSEVMDVGRMPLKLSNDVLPYLVQECRVECRRMEELTFLHEVVCLHLLLALQVDEEGVGLVNGMAVWLLLLSSMCQLLVPCRGWWIFPALAAAPSKPENSTHGG